MPFKREEGAGATSVNGVVFNQSEFDRYMEERLPQMLELAHMQTKRFLRETGQWGNDMGHEKLAQRWAYELVERFLKNGLHAIPCRPLHLFNSFVCRYYSQPDSFRLAADQTSPSYRFLDGLLTRAVSSRDAMVVVFYHLYGFGQQQVASILALGPVESQRIYKNYMRWRSAGWSRMVDEIGLRQSDLRQIQEQQERHTARFHREVERYLSILLPHYRKSEPAHYRCLAPAEWRELYAQDYGHDYRAWHLPLCHGCLREVWNLHSAASEGERALRLTLHVHPLTKVAASNDPKHPKTFNSTCSMRPPQAKLAISGPLSSLERGVVAVRSR